MTKLSQLIAVVAGQKTRTKDSLTRVYQFFQKPDLFNGLTRAYTPRTEDGETLPSESKIVQQGVEPLLTEAFASVRTLWKAVADQDQANTKAVGYLTIDGRQVGPIPVTHLLFLEKQLVDLRTAVSAIPLPDPTERWSRDAATGQLRSEPTQTVRTKKEPRVITLAAATDKHPAQVQVMGEDLPVGTWTTTKLSGTIQPTQKDALLARINRLIDSVKSARELANLAEVEETSFTDPIVDHLLAGLKS